MEPFEQAMKDCLRKFMDNGKLGERILTIDNRLFIVLDAEKELIPLVRAILKVVLYQQDDQPS